MADQEATFHPGDIQVGDLNGVVCIPKELVGQVLEILPGQVAADAKIRKDLEMGEKFTVSSSRHRL
jgi:regulator of RNase E activity RraA